MDDVFDSARNADEVSIRAVEVNRSTVGVNDRE